MVFCLIALFMYACSSNNTESKNADSASSEASSPASADAGSYDEHRGEGKFKDVQIGTALDKDLAAKGKLVADVKCASCHKLTDEKLVGPGWKGVTERRKPEWVMNFVTNPDAMLDKDPALQAQLELCLVRMPNQNISDEEARQVFEYMRQNDGVK